MKRKCVGIVLFKDVEPLDFCGPFEVFISVRLDEEKRRDPEQLSPFEVFLVAEQAAPVVAYGDLQIIPHHAFETCPHLDILVVPGGLGPRTEKGNSVLLDWLRTRATEAELVTSVCTGSMLLGFAGLLDGLHATTHTGALPWMRKGLPNVIARDDLRVVEAGPEKQVITSAGISAGIDMALKVVARYHGEDVAKATAKHMEYPYPEDDRR